MTNKPIKFSRFIPSFSVVPALVFICLFLTAPVFSNEYKPLVPKPEQSRMCLRIINALDRYHYLEKNLDNAMSSIILDRMLKQMDPGKKIFTAQDIASLKQYKFRLDDALKRGNLNPGFDIFNLYLERSVDRLDYILSLISTWESQFDFTSDEFLVTDNELRQWPKDEASLRAVWKKDLKNHIITMILDDRDPKTITSDLEKIYQNRKNLLLQRNATDGFRFFMNSVTSSYDPHTQFFPPMDSETFDIRLSLSLEGIGALLQTEYEYTKVVRLVPKGPADKSNLLMPGDKIIGVGQGKDGEIKDVIGHRIDDVVKLIRGPKHTIVRLKIIPAKKDDVTKTIQIVRDQVKLEDQSAKKDIITLNHENKTLKIGVIEIPTFYMDFDAFNRGDKNYKSSTRDVKKLLDELKKEKIDGLIVDLRDNGGGSLPEAQKLSGLFIKSGPIVQVRDKAQVMKYYDDDPEIYFQGPMIVLINRMSASASEIFAGAMKDYNRAVIVGSRSYGKGTVQHVQRLGKAKLKMTSAKFYRISGESTQHKGILPDIPLPDFFKAEDTGESSYDNALPWDTIYRTFFHAYRPLNGMNQKLLKAFQKRSEKDPELAYLNKRIDLASRFNNEQQISLNLEKRKARKQEYTRLELEIENDYLKSTNKPVLKELDSEHLKIHEAKEILMKKAYRIMEDFIMYSKALEFSW